MLLFGRGPGLYLDLAAFIFQVPNSGSCACASRVPASNSAIRLMRIRMVFGFILHLSYGQLQTFFPLRIGGGPPRASQSFRDGVEFEPERLVFGFPAQYKPAAIRFDTASPF